MIRLNKKLINLHQSTQTITGQVINVDAKHSSLVGAVARVVCKEEGLDASEQALHYKCLRLDDERPLSHFNIQNEATLHLVQKSEGSEARKTKKSKVNIVQPGTSCFYSYPPAPDQAPPPPFLLDMRTLSEQFADLQPETKSRLIVCSKQNSNQHSTDLSGMDAVCCL